MGKNFSTLVIFFIKLAKTNKQMTDTVYFNITNKNGFLKRQRETK